MQCMHGRASRHLYSSSCAAIQEVTLALKKPRCSCWKAVGNMLPTPWLVSSSVGPHMASRHFCSDRASRAMPAPDGGWLPGGRQPAQARLGCAMRWQYL